MDQTYNRIDYKVYSPLNAKEMHKIEKRLIKQRQERINEKSGKPSKKNHNTTISETKTETIKRNFKKQNDTALRKFIRAYQKELQYSSYEKIFYIIKEEDVIQMFVNKGFLKVTESILKENIWEKKTRKRYYVQYDKHEKFIEYLNEKVIPPFKNKNKIKK